MIHNKNCAVNGKSVSSAAARALQKTGLLPYFWDQQEIPFFDWKEFRWAWVSLLQQEGFTRQESFASGEFRNS